MYILISITTNDFRLNQMVSKRKSIIVKYLKTNGYYWSKKLKRYIDDKTSGEYGGSGCDYVIEQIDEIK